MIHKEIKIPKVFHELHGEKSRLSTLIMVYLSGVTLAALVVSQLLSESVAVWKLLLVGILFLDIGGGLVANLSTSTNRYYQGKPHLRIIFLLLHVIHPGLLLLVFPGAWPYFVFVGSFTLASALLVNACSDAESQQNLAALLIVIGIGLSLFFKAPFLILYSFAPFFMIKLILGFAVRRPSMTQS